MITKHVLAAIALVAALDTFAPVTSAQELALRAGVRAGDARIEASYGRHIRPSYGRDRIRPRYGSHLVWVAGRYETVRRKVWVPGCTQRTWIAPIRETRHDPCGNEYTILIEAGHWEDVWRPGHYEIRNEQVWRPGHWENRRSYRRR